MKTFAAGLGAGLLALLLLEVGRVYFIMPFPGSQLDDAANLGRVEVAYWLHQNVPWLRVVLLLGLLWPTYQLLKRPARRWLRWLPLAGLLLYGGVLYGINSQLMADHMFYQPRTKRMVPMSRNTIPTDKLVLGVFAQGEARAYPLQLIGYHHQVRDTVGGQPILVTYCTVCRTGRVYSPVVAGKAETFRLVGMDHYNALFEDKTTGSWWRQATGEAIVGPRRGQTLAEVGGQHLTLAEWATEHPTTLVMQPDPAFRAETDSLATFDTGIRRGKLTRRDSASWQPKSWVVGVRAGGSARAFDWNDLLRRRLINDTVGTQPVLVAVAPDQRSFRVWSRTVTGRVLQFDSAQNGQFTDRQTQSHWNRQGRALTGPLAGQQLRAVRAYQENWHSWQSFHP